MVGGIKPSPYPKMPTSLSPEFTDNVGLHDKGEVRMLVEVRVLISKPESYIILDYPGWSTRITKVLKVEEGGRRGGLSDIMLELDLLLLALKMEKGP